MAQSKNRAYSIQKGGGILLLHLNGRSIRADVHRKIEIGGFAFGEAQVSAVVPLHRSSGTCAEVAAFLGGHFEVLHADLIAIVQERYSGKCEEEGVSKLKLGRIQVVAGTDRVVVAGQNGDVAELFCVLVPVEILVEEAGYAAAGIFFEVTVILRVPVAVNTAAVVVIVAHLSVE